MAKSRTKKTRQNPTSNDPATQYAIDVTGGKIIAGPWVRAACNRHLQDLNNGHERGLYWDVAEVERVIGYFRDVLTVELEFDDPEFGNVSEAVPFELHPCQAFIIGSLFGWKKNGLRRFRRAFIEQGKGNGKSPLAAGIGHYMLTAARKLRAEVYSAATDKDQAAILFRDAVEMWRRSPALTKRLVPSGINPVWQLTLPETSSFFKPISSEKKGKSGIRPYCALIDEVHEHPDNSVIEMLRAGTKGNQEALIFEITNSGHDRTSVCFNEHEYSIKIATGELENDAWFSYVCALDDGDDPFEDESCWIKANPLLGVTIQPQFVREQVEEARGMPSKESMVRRLHFCQWVGSEDGWITAGVWLPCEHDIDIEDYAGMPCYGGLDMSYTEDLSAIAWAFLLDDGYIDLFVDFFRPKEGLSAAVKRDHVPYDLWERQGHLITTPGKVIKLPAIANRMAEIAALCDVQAIAYDRYRHRELQDDLLDLDIDLPLIEHPQGFRRAGEAALWMPNSVQALENAIIEGRLRVRRNPLLRWNVASAIIRPDPAGTDNRIFDKRKSRVRIDGVVAAAMAVGAAETAPNQRSVYEERGFIAL